jgi:hypothetical protein
MVAAKGAGIASRCAATWRIWRVASQNFTHSEATSATAKTRVKVVAGSMVEV